MRSSVCSFAAYSSFVFALLAPSLALAKRSPPAEVPPVVDGNFCYEVPHGGFGDPPTPCGQIGGCVVAYDNTTGALLWSVKVYSISYDPDLEEDVQWVFITCLSLKNGQLLVTNERGSHFAIDPATQQVTGDPRGCDTTSSGCTGEAGGCDAGLTSSGDARDAPGSTVRMSSGCTIVPRGPPATCLFPALAMLGVAAVLSRRKRRGP
jgi:hypothetical protein